MTTVRRVDRKEIKKAARPGLPAEAPPVGISPVLRASWNFARETAHRFSKELASDRAAEFLKNLTKRFS